LAAACGCSRSSPEDVNPVVTVDVAPVLTSTIQDKVTGDSLLFPVRQAAIVPKITAPVKKVYVNRGDRVRAGQVLLELEDKDLAAAVTESKAAYDQAEAAYQTAVRATLPEEVQKAQLDVRAAKDALDAQQAVFNSRQSLFMQGAIAQKDVNDAQVALSQARNQYEIAQKHLENLQGFANAQAVKSAEAQRDAAKGRYDSAAAQLSYARVTSPIDGVVTDRPVYPGEMPAAGDPANLLVPNAAPVAGTVSQVSPALDTGGTTVEVWVEAPNPDMSLRPGTSVPVEMISQTVQNALVIPQPAVITSASGTTSVIVIDAENKPKKTTVTLGIRDGMNVQVTDGLSSGQRVATTGAFGLAKLDDDVLAKTKVQIAPPKEEDDEDK
jgi:multidrug efflux pump subunit AcrA (membrane-fusion protein)